MKSIDKFNEREVEPHAATMLASIGIRMVGPIKLWAGASPRDGYELDALGVDDDGYVVVAEFKVNRNRGVVGQLLTYIHIVRETAKAAGLPLGVRGVIASTHVDFNWIAIADQLRQAGVVDIAIKAIVQDGTTGRLVLVEPDRNNGWVRDPAGNVDGRKQLIERLQDAARLLGDKRRA